MRKNKLHDQAKDIYIKSHGAITPKEIAETLGIAPEKVRKWKYRGKWEQELSKPRRGAPRGNQNAVGHGAPEDNQNAVTHGAYAKPRIENLTPEQQKDIENLQADFLPNALRHLRRLEIKRADLENRIANLQNMPENSADLLDRSMHMQSPKGDTHYTFASAPFTRRMILEAELNRTDGRILKLLDSIRNQAAEQLRLDLERERLEFQKQKAVGIYNFDDAGNVIPEEAGKEPEIVE